VSDFASFADAVRASGVGRNVVLLRTVDSTNRLARSVVNAALAGETLPGSAWLISWEQTSGRGRRGRSWTSEPGDGIYATLVWPLPPEASSEIVSFLPLVVGVAACRALDPDVGEGTLGLKWPNDLMVGGRKLGGVLIELVERGDGSRTAIVGIGVNHGQTRDRLPTNEATSLRLVFEDRGPSLPSLSETTVSLCRAVGDELDARRPVAEVLEDVRDLSVHRPGDRLTWLSSHGEVSGQFAGFDERGCILLERQGGREVISSGDVVQVHASDDGQSG